MFDEENFLDWGLPGTTAMDKEQWYPGSMARALECLQKNLAGLDLVVELLDARIPHCSRNPVFNQLYRNKSHFLLLHKADQAENNLTTQWCRHFQDQGIAAASFSIRDSNPARRLLQHLSQQGKKAARPRFKRPLRVIFVGIPNVGKSTLINLAAGKAVSQTANRPGITRGRQWIRVLPNLDLLDTPGILWPKIDAHSISPLASIGAIPFSRVDLQDTACWLLQRFEQRGLLAGLLKRYRATGSTSEFSLLEQIGFGQGCLLPGGKADLERAAALILRDYQSGALGPLTLEEPPQH